ncbi:MAG: hypothetical protein VW268_07335 [Rhodospirillaceae bacterium]
MTVVLHGDVSSGRPADYIQFIARAAVEVGATAVAMARPGYTIDDRQSSGTATRDQSRGDRFLAPEIDSIATAIKNLKAHHKAGCVVLIGHSRGALILGVLLRRAAPLADVAVLISCPCYVQDWRASRGGDDMSDAQSPYMYIDRIPTRARVYALTGEKDRNTLPRCAEAYVAGAVKRGIAATFILAPGAGHGMRGLKKQPHLLDAVRAATRGQ